MLPKLVIGSLFVLLVWGNLVSGLEAGLACPDWPLCYGKFFPEYRWDIFMEHTHRMIGAVFSILFFIYAYKVYKRYSGNFKLIPLITVILLVIQIVLGGIVVLTRLPVDITTIHFGNAMIIFSLVLYQVYFDGMKRKPKLDFSGASGLFFFLSVIILIQAVFGAYVRHSNAGLACPDFPTCLGYLIPPALDGIVLTHFTHRVMAYAIILIFIFLFFYSRFNENLKHINRNISMILGFIFIQILLGILVVESRLTFYVTGLHLAFALIILSLCLLSWFKYINRNYV